MGRMRWTPCLALCAVIVTSPSALGAVTEHVSVDSLGVLGNAGSTFSSVSADGRFVAFVSRASNLVPGDSNGTDDVFVRDRMNGDTVRVSVGTDGVEANAMSTAPAISADGMVVAFVSAATNLVAGDTNGRLDVFVHERATGTTQRVSVDSLGNQASSDTFAPSLSEDGSRVAFASDAPDLVPGDGNGTFDAFVHDRATGTTVRVSVDSTGAESNGASLAPRISSDGLVVAFHSSATNLVASDLNFSNDVFVHDLAAGTTEMASLNSSGTQGNFQSVAGSLSADGRFVAFDSDATNLAPDDMNFRTDVFVRDRQTGVTERVSVATDGTEGNGQSGFVDPPAISADGRFVAFASGASNLVAADGNNFVDMFVRDRAAGETTRVSVASDGTEGDAPAAHWPSLSGDGSVVVFASLATNLVPGDTNGAQDVFARGSSCGNGVVDDGEQCDDGNLDDGDCCTAACTMAPLGTSCDDGDLCTGGDFCAYGVCSSGPFDPESCSDPMRCYTARPADGSKRVKPGKVTIADAFQDGRANVRGVRNMCAATDLDGVDSMPFDGPRLACHIVRNGGGLDSLEGEEVTISNRYGVQSLEVYRPRRLCLASDVDAPPGPGSRDHYMCYRVGAIGDTHDLRLRGMYNDAFGQFESRLTKAVELCVATRVDGSAAAHPDAHLVCYRGRDKRYRTSGDVFETRQETVHHDYGTETLDLIRLRKICVPSEIIGGGTPPPIG